MFFSKKKFVSILFLFTLIQAADPPRIGLALSGGGSKGFAQIAVLKALDSLNIPIDYIAGTSFGAIVGAMYAIGYSGKQIEKMAMATDWYEVQKDEPKRKYLPHFRKKDTGKYQLKFDLDKFTPVAPTGLIYGQKIILELSKWTREYEQVYDFDQLPIPFRCNAFDILSGKEIVIKEGSLAHALRASLSIPTIFVPVERGKTLLVDGGVANNLPVDIVQDMGADIILAIDVSSTIQSKSGLRNMYDIIDQTITVHGYEKKFENIENSDYYIHPEINNISFTDFRPSTMQYLFDCGEEAVRANWEIFLELQKITAGRKLNTVEMQPLKRPLVSKITIQGNKELTEFFIREYIGLEKNAPLNLEILDDNISELYSLGYFKTLYYEIHPNIEGWVDIIIHVEESSLRKLHLGLRWDNRYDFVGTANVQLNTKLIPGIRMEGEIQFAGSLWKNELILSYPSRRLNFPIYPYFKITNAHYPFDHYSTERFELEGLYTYYADEVRSGLGLILKNYWNTEIEYFWKKSGLQTEVNLENPVSDTDNVNVYSGIRMLAQLDLLDNVLIPKDGIFIKGTHEQSVAQLGSSKNYEFYQVWGKIYKTFHLNTYGISGYYHQAEPNTPLSLTTIFEGSQIFAGTEEFQLHGSSITFFRLDYRYKYKKNIFAHYMVNWLMDAKSEDLNYSAGNLWGAGVGITLITPIGPMQFMWTWGPKNIYTNKDRQNLFHFSAGYKF